MLHFSRKCWLRPLRGEQRGRRMTLTRPGIAGPGGWVTVSINLAFPPVYPHFQAVFPQVFSATPPLGWTSNVQSDRFRL